MRVEVWGRVRSDEVEPKYWHTVSNRTAVRTDVLGNLGVHPNDAAVIHDARNNQEEPVLVDVVQPLEDEQRLINSVSPGFPVHSAVRLELLNQAPDLPAPDFRPDLSSDQHALLTERRITDRKMSLLPRRSAVEQYQLPGKMIKRSTEIEEDLSELEAPLGVDGGNPVRGVDMLAGYRINLDLESVAAGVKDGLEGLFRLAIWYFARPTFKSTPVKSPPIDLPRIDGLQR
jgi:hypothetical protein